MAKKNQRVAMVMSEVFLRRLTPGMMSFVGDGHDYWVIDIYRPIPELKMMLRSWKPDGIITEALPEITEALVSLGIPTVIADTDTVYEGAISLDVDDWAIGVKVANHLMNIGLQHFAFLGNDTPYSEQRYTGFHQTLAKSGYECNYHEHTFHGPKHYIEHWRGSENVLQAWLEQLPKPVGVLAAHDPLGRSLCEVCRDMNLPVPEAVAVVGVNDDDLVCALANPPLSSVAIPWEKLAFTAAEYMERLIADRSFSCPTILIPPLEVVSRQSSNLLAVEDARIAKALKYIREHAFSDIKITDVCKAVPISRRTLELQFKQMFQRTPRDEIMRIRIEHAQQLLAETDLSMPIVAERSGFSNAERFSVVFKQLNQETPSAYRKRYQLK